MTWRCFVFGHRWKFVKKLEKKNHYEGECIWCGKHETGETKLCPKCKKAFLYGGISKLKCPLCDYEE